MKDPINRVWLPITEVEGIAQSTLRRWCETGQVRARCNNKKWEIYIPALLELEDEERDAISQAFEDAAKHFATEGPNDIFLYGPKK